jgi:UDP-3-O-[3-hydroxymyristoyl] glucosamine N-acyltransferase
MTPSQLPPFSWHPTNIAEWVQGELVGTPVAQINGFATLADAGPNQLTFLDDAKYLAQLNACQAALVLVSAHINLPSNLKMACIRVPNAREALLVLLQKATETIKQASGIEAGAWVSESAQIHETAWIHAGAVVRAGAIIDAEVQVHSGALISEGVVVGAGTQIGSGVQLLAACRIGKKCIIQSNTVIGSDGFGYMLGSSGLQKIPHLGSVVIEDQVEIGANCSIDQGMLSPTRIHQGVKIDNQVHIAHNVQVGAHTVIAAQTGVAGSVVIGKACRIGGQVGFVDGIHIADGVEVAAQSGIMNSIHEPGSKVWGSPAMPAQQFRKSFVLFRRLPELVKTWTAHEK